ncbi:MAG: mycothiol synthase [Actinomycetales bacterium]
MTASAVRIQWARHLSGAQITEVADLVHRVALADGVHPLSEHAWLHLRHGGDEHAQHLLALDSAGRIVGYGHLDATDEVAGPSTEVVVDPDHRRQGVGTRLITEMIDAIDGRSLRMWAHGEQAAAGQWARALGFERTRVLWQMRRSLHAPLPGVNLPDGIRLRPFQPGIDDQAWVDLNHRAFAGHPEQGGWTLADLHHRMAEPWFSAQGFLLAVTHESAVTGRSAVTGERMVGFHWTKVHGIASHAHEAIGEVYVVGVDPDWQGRGLGRAVTLAGLHHLRSLGLSAAMLYVEASNAPAIDLYSSLGFVQWDVDVLYRSRQT